MPFRTGDERAGTANPSPAPAAPPPAVVLAPLPPAPPNPAKRGPPPTAVSTADKGLGFAGKGENPFV